MRVSMGNLSVCNSQPLRNKDCCDRKPSFHKSHDKQIDYKKEYEKARAQLDYMSKKYEVLCNICALGMNKNFK